MTATERSLPLMANPLLNDPLYNRFNEGLRKHLSYTFLPERWRWHPYDSNWWSYPGSAWTLIEISHRAWPKAPIYQPGSELSINPFKDDLTELYQQVTSEYAALRSAHGAAIWEPISGAWADPVTPSSGHGGDQSKTKRPVEERIEYVRDLVRRHVITVDEGERRIQEILGEDT